MKQFFGVLGAVAALGLAATPALAVPDHYDLGKPHTQILFSADHLGFTHSWGKFLSYHGTFDIERARPAEARVEVTIDTNSVDMGDEPWNKAVRKMFRVEQFPSMTFKSTRVAPRSATTADVTGDLTLLGKSRPVTLHVTFNKADRDPFGTYVMGFSAVADIRRSDFGMTDYLPAVGDDVHIVIEAEGKRKDRADQGQFNR